VRKNPKRKSCKWHGRIRQGGREKLVALNTQDKAEADRWLARQKYLYGEYLAGNVQLSEILTVDSTPVLAQKRASTAVLSLRDCLDGWEQKRRMEAKRETTIATYGRALRIMVDPAMPVTDFGPEQVKAIMASKAGLKPATRRFYSKALLSFCDFLRTEYGCVGLCEALPKVKVDEAPRSYWTPNEMATILLEIESDTAEKTIQYRQYFTLMSQVGSRQGETGKITWADVFDDGHGNGCVRFRGETTKARVGRTVPISFELWAELEDRRGRPDGLVFDAISDCQATRYYVLQKALRKLGLTGNLHKWRHSVSMAMYSKSKDIKACSQLLGHSAAVAMKYYLEARSLEELRELVED
jgi:integrase